MEKDFFWETRLTVSCHEELVVDGTLGHLNSPDAVDVDPQYLNALWKTIEDSLEAILRKKRFKTTKTTIYDACEMLCFLHRERELFERCESALRLWLRQSLRPIIKSIGRSNDACTTKKNKTFLHQVASWNTHWVEAMTWLELLFTPLTRHYIDPYEKTCFRNLASDHLQTFFRKKMMWSSLRHGIMSLLSELRHDTKTLDNVSLLGDIVQFSQNIGLYFSHVEGVFLEDAQTYFSQYVSRTLEVHPDISIMEYLLMVTSVMDHDQHVLHPLLPSSTVASLTDVKLNMMIKEQLDWILSGSHPTESCTLKLCPDSGLSKLLNSMEKDALAQLYQMCHASHCLDKLALYWALYIETEGSRLARNPLVCNVVDHHHTQPFHVDDGTTRSTGSGDTTRLCCWIQLKRLVSYVVTFLFHNHDLFIQTTRTSWIDLFNKTPEIESTSASLLNQYTSLCLSSTQHASKESIQQVLKDIIVLLEYLHGKDLYQELYYHNFEKRLLQNPRETDYDMEHYMISLLCQEYGEEYVKKNKAFLDALVRLVTGLTTRAVLWVTQNTSQDILKAFQLHFTSHSENPKPNDSVDFHCTLLPFSLMTSTVHKREAKHSCTTYPTDGVPSLLVLRHAFEQFYRQMYPQRVLHWSSTYATCSLLVTSSSVAHPSTILVSQTQAVCLLLFNTRDQVTVQDMISRTGLCPEDIVSHMEILSHASSIPLLHYDKVHELFLFNQDFAMSSSPVSYVDGLYKDTDITQVVSTLEEDRSYHIDAFIVRTMKSVKTLPYQQIESRTLEYFQGHVMVTQIAERVKSLVDREFIFQDMDNPSLYHYMSHPD